MTDMSPDAMVVKALDGLLVKAAKAQKAGASVTRRTYYRVDPHDGHLWAEVVFTTDDGKGTIHKESLPIDSPEGLDAYDASITAPVGDKATRTDRRLGARIAADIRTLRRVHPRRPDAPSGASPGQAAYVIVAPLARHRRTASVAEPSSLAPLR